MNKEIKEEPKKCMYSKDNYTDEDRKVLCDGCEEECKFKPTTSVWHDASERAEKGRLYLYRTNQNIVDINRSEGKDFPDYCERWAYIDDLLKL